MLLNFEKFSNYADEFNNLMDKFNKRFNETCEKCDHFVTEREVKQMIFEIFPHDWIIFGSYRVYTLDTFKLTYHKVCTLSASSLTDLQTHINNVISLCDNSYQTLQDFDQFDISGL